MTVAVRLDSTWDRRSADSRLFLAQDAGILRAFAGHAPAGLRIRIYLADPDGPIVAECGSEEMRRRRQGSRDP
jgi:hypothetical protein